MQAYVHIYPVEGRLIEHNRRSPPPFRKPTKCLSAYTRARVNARRYTSPPRYNRVLPRITMVFPNYTDDRKDYLDRQDGADTSSAK